MTANQTILQMKYARIIALVAEMKHISLEDAMDIFYHSTTFKLISGGISDIHTMSDKYLAEEICIEIEESSRNNHQ